MKLKITIIFLIMAILTLLILPQLFHPYDLPSVKNDLSKQQLGIDFNQEKTLYRENSQVDSNNDLNELGIKKLKIKIEENPDNMLLLNKQRQLMREEHLLNDYLSYLDRIDA